MNVSDYKELFKIFKKNNEELYFVGGCVRDHLLDKQPNDVDFATSAEPKETMKFLSDHGFKVIPIGVEFGTIQTLVNGEKVEITTYRCSESYTKGSRKPAVVFGESIEEDLARRDFTINAMAMDGSGNIIDPFNGRRDLYVRKLDTPSTSPEQSFGDDPLRMLRACRFEARGFEMYYFVSQDILDMSDKILEVSAERIFEETTKILLSDYPDEGLQAMVDSGLMQHIFPELQTVVEFKNDQGKYHSKNVWEHTKQVVVNTPPKAELRWAALFHDVAKPQTYSETDSGIHFYGHEFEGAKLWDDIAKRLKVSNDFHQKVRLLILEHLTPSLLSSEGPWHVSDKALRRFAYRVGDHLEDLFDLSLADITSHNPKVVEEKTNNCIALRERIERLLDKDNVNELKLPTGLGNVLMEELNIQGPDLGEVMKELKQKLIDGDIDLQCDFVLEAKKINLI